MRRQAQDVDGHRQPRPRPPLPIHVDDNNDGMTHAELVEARRHVAGLVDVTGGAGERSNFQVRGRQYLHFDRTPAGEIYADVKVGGGPSADFDPVWAATPNGRAAPMRRVRRDVRRIDRR